MENVQEETKDFYKNQTANELLNDGNWLTAGLVDSIAPEDPNDPPAKVIEIMKELKAKPDKTCDYILAWMMRAANEQRFNEFDEIYELLEKTIGTPDENKQAIYSFHGYGCNFTRYTKKRDLLQPYVAKKDKEWYDAQKAKGKE